MKQVTFILLTGVFTFALGAGVMFWTKDAWLPLVQAPVEKKKEDDHAGHAHGSKDRIKLSAQARANLHLVTDELELKTFRRTIQVPGVVVERRGKGDQSITARVAGVVKKIHALPGDIVHLGEPLVTLRINSEPLQSSQTELYKAAQEIKITTDQKERLDKLFKQGTVPESKILDLQYQLDRLNATRKAYRADLALKGLLPEMIDQVEKGEFSKEFIVRVPSTIEGFKPSLVSPVGDKNSATPLLEVEELKVFPGEQVQAGHLLGYLSNHQNLYIEGRGFREDTPFLEKTASKGWALHATFHEEKAGDWPVLKHPLTILYLANNIDPMSQTFPFYVPLPNQYREYEQASKKYRIWRYRPGQRVQLGVPVQEFEEVFVLPIAAVVREGADVFVFRQNGDVFERKAVHVVYEDSTQVVLANDGSVLPGTYVAFNAADALNRALKAQSEEGGKTGHEGHSH